MTILIDSQRSSEDVQPSRWQVGLALVFLLILWFGALEYRDLFHPDEGRYAEIPREMVASGDWITPRLNDLKYFEKPVLQYWITAVSYKLLGEDEWTARLWPALSGFLTLLLVYLTGKRLSGRRAGIAAALILASTFEFFVFSQVLTLDMGLTFFMTLALSSFIASRDTRCNSSERRNWAILIWIAMALAVLSKGLVGLVLPGLVFVAYVVVERDWKMFGHVHLLPNVLVFLATAMPWFIWVQMRNPEFFQFFFIHEHFGRYATTAHHRSGGWYYFLIMLLIGTVPWTFAYAAALKRAWRNPAPDHFDVKPFRLLVLWVVVITGFYSLSQSKLPGYIVPVYPALGLLLGCAIGDGRLRLSFRHLFGIGAAGGVLAIVAPFITHVPKFATDADLIRPYVPWIMAAGLSIVATSVLGLSLFRSRYRYVLPVVALGSLVTFQLVVSGTQSIANQFSVEELVESAQQKTGLFASSAPFYSVGMYDQTLSLEIKRPVVLVAYQDELAMGISEEPERAIKTIEEFRQRWFLERQAYAIMTPKRLVEEQNLGTPMIVLVANKRVVIVARK